MEYIPTDRRGSGDHSGEKHKIMIKKNNWEFKLREEKVIKYRELTCTLAISILFFHRADMHDDDVILTMV